MQGETFRVRHYKTVVAVFGPYSVPQPQPQTLTTSELRDQLPEITRRVVAGEAFPVRHYTTLIGTYGPYPTRLKEHATMTHAPTVRPITAALYNQAGGSCKTSLVRDIGYEAGQRGLRVLLIDADPQGSLTRWMGGLEALDSKGRVMGDRAEYTALDVMTGRTDELPEPQHLHGVDLIIGNRFMESAVPILANDHKCMINLRRAVDALGDRYDLVLIDTPPADNALVTACMIAADYVFTPVSASKGIDRIDTVTEAMTRARAFYPNLMFGGFLPANLHLRRAPGGEGYAPGHFSDVLNVLKTDFKEVGPTFPEIRARPALFNDAAAQMMPVAVFSRNHEAVTELAELTTQVLLSMGFQITEDEEAASA